MTIADGEFSEEFIGEVRGGLHDGWRWLDSAQGQFLVDTKGGQSWRLHWDERPSRAYYVVAAKHPPKQH